MPSLSLGCVLMPVCTLAGAVLHIFSSAVAFHAKFVSDQVRNPKDKISFDTVKTRGPLVL